MSGVSWRDRGTSVVTLKYRFPSEKRNCIRTTGAMEEVSDYTEDMKLIDFTVRWWYSHLI